jgi:alpha-L-arabinofuranosidase
MSKLVWNGAAAGDVHGLLPAVGEAPTPKVRYWEIGNEPRVGLTSSYKITNSYTFLAPGRPVDSTHKYDYHTRYASMTAAMKAIDPTIKVGPCLQSATAITEKEILNTVLNKQANGQYLPLDFISYHPYQRMMDVTTAPEISTFMQGIYDVQKGYVDNLRSMVAASGRNANSVELISSETNVSYFLVNDTAQEGQMAHALGSTETVFSFARLGLSAAHYWLWPVNQFDGTEYPIHKAYEGLRDHMGDTLVSTYTNGNTRLYTTRDSQTGEIAVWGLNFSNDTDASLKLALSGLNLTGYDATRMTLGATSGPTTLFSTNFPGGAMDVDWTSTNLGNINTSSYPLTLPAATISVLVLKPAAVPEPGMIAAIGAIFLCLPRRRPCSL